MSFSSIYPVEVGEALGLFHALQWRHDMQFNNVDFVVNSKLTTDAFNFNMNDITKFRHIITTF